MPITPFTAEQHRAWFAGLPKKVNGAGMILTDIDTGNILAVKATYKHHWSFPGGVVDALESPNKAAVRELFEETGIEIPLDSIEFAGVCHRLPNGAELDSLYFLFQAQVRAADLAPQPDLEEIEATEWLSPDEFISRCNNIPHIVYGIELVSGREHRRFIEAD